MLSLPKFIITNTYKACKELIKDILKFITRVLEPITFPWAAAHMTQVYYEITNFYLGQCIKQEVPFIQPTTKDLAYTTSHVKRVYFYDDIKDNMTYGLPRMIKLILAPYSIAAPYKEALKQMKDRVEEHNSQFVDEEIDIVSTKMALSLDIYSSVFNDREFIDG